ncbi:MAG: hypothetical protein GX552_17590, partial [Chloroflexi bacterium]|nr:hypothetical protein [Chloroflexota bacterium]
MQLETSPLSELLVETGTRNATRGQKLRGILVSAVEQLRPGGAVPASHGAWTSYRLLELHYVQGLSQAQVCSQLGFSRASFYRYREAALGAIVNLLWQRAQSRTTEGRVASAPRAEQDIAEAVRLARQSTGGEVAITSLVDGVVRTATPLAVGRAVRVRWQCADALTAVYGDPATFRQVLLGVLSEALLLSHGGELVLTAGLERGRSTWCLRGLPVGALSAEAIEAIPGLRLA